MTPDEIKQLWQSQGSARITIPGKLLLDQVQRNERSFSSMIWWRDVREIGVAVALIPIWILMGRRAALPWTWYLAIPGILFVAGFMVVDRFLHKPAVETPEPLKQAVQTALAQV